MTHVETFLTCVSELDRQWFSWWLVDANPWCWLMPTHCRHYNDVIMGAIASQLNSLTIVYSIVYWVADQRKHQRSASLAFVWGIHRGPVNSPPKWPVTRKMFPFDDVITHWSRVTHMCVSSLTIIGSDNGLSPVWLVACPAPSHYLNQCWIIVNWTIGNKFQWNLNRNWYIFSQENAFQNVVWKMAAILSRPHCVD